jgi:predicted enzyme related to lactoylglutathione lyase
MNNEFCHIELSTDDPAKAREFYAGLFSWKFEQMPMGDSTYTMIRPGSGAGGGITRKMMPNQPTAWLAYVEVDNVESSVKKAADLGGKVVVPPSPIPNMGFFAILQDPSGAVFGIWAKA